MGFVCERIQIGKVFDHDHTGRAGILWSMKDFALDTLDHQLLCSQFRQVLLHGARRAPRDRCQLGDAQVAIVPVRLVLDENLPRAIERHGKNLAQQFFQVAFPDPSSELRIEILVVPLVPCLFFPCFCCLCKNGCHCTHHTPPLCCRLRAKLVGHGCLIVFPPESVSSLRLEKKRGAYARSIISFLPKSAPQLAEGAGSLARARSGDQQMRVSHLRDGRFNLLLQHTCHLGSLFPERREKARRPITVIPACCFLTQLLASTHKYAQSTGQNTITNPTFFPTSHEM